MSLPAWHEIKSRASFLRRKDLDGMRIAIPWPTEAVPDPEKPIPLKLGKLVPTTANATGWGVQLPSGSVIELPSKGFQAHCVMVDKTAGQGRRDGA